MSDTPGRSGRHLGDADTDDPFHPRWPLLVSEDVKGELLVHLAEVVHTRPSSDFARGFETGMAVVMLHLGINEAASPERRRLPEPDSAMYQPRAGAVNPSEDGHAYLSTACLHGGHGYCQADTGAAGTKVPAQCKFCAAPCICDCHRLDQGAR